MSQVDALKAAVTQEIDLLEVIEALAADMSHTHDQIEGLHALTFTASSAPEFEAMAGALTQIKQGLEEVYRGVNTFRENGNQYVGRL